VEADELAQLVADTAYSEAALLRQWVLAGMQQFRVSVNAGSTADRKKSASMCFVKT
jgi:hypothetical protein